MWLFTPKERMRKINIVIHFVCQGPRDISKERRNIMTTNPVHQELLTLACTNIPSKWRLDSSCPLASIMSPVYRRVNRIWRWEKWKTPWSRGLLLLRGKCKTLPKKNISVTNQSICSNENLFFCFVSFPRAPPPSLFFWSLSDPKLIGHWRAAETRF